ncbi:MAG: hypothetical protein HFG51_04135 [Lachnospiraceae bacterium]|nr:hypothetical protein [Lachnospiraceae bacterium]
MARHLFVHMLGDFYMELENKKLELPGSIFSKTKNLFLLILLYGEAGIEKRKAMELLYQNDDGDESSQYGRFRVLVYRLKKYLIELGLMQENDTLHKKGVFCWQPQELEIQIDAKIFESAAKEALINQTAESFDRACTFYQGEFLTELTSEPWVAQKQVYFQNLYTQCVRSHLRLLNAGKHYGCMLEAAKRAARLYPYEEWYIGWMEALMGMERWKEAFQVSEELEKNLMDQMGLRPSPEVQERVQKINMQIRGSSKQLWEIRQELEEKDYPQGGFFCNYSTFAWAYRYKIRKTARDGLSHYLLLCSLTEIQEGNSWFQEGEVLDTTMEYLGESITVSLRRTDIYTRYSKNQYLMLMFQMKQEDCSHISQRIEQKFRKYPGVRKFRLHYYYAPVIQNLPASWKSPKSFHTHQKM